MNPFAGENVGAVFVTVIDEVRSSEAFLVMAQDEAFGKIRVHILLDPVQLVGPGGRVVPWCRGKNMDIVLLAEFVDGIDGAGNRVHQSEYAGSILRMIFVGFPGLGRQPIDTGVEVDQDAVHIHIYCFLDKKSFSRRDRKGHNNSWFISD